ncbi:hypothetical protein ABT063_01610 [Streptomyces sp. NPDC002838]|uniref:hypothetical protein n=1 Tax=Streptomyces sp. NPDC002838 TaxID=3154436 RepID=UPI00332A7833
MRIVSTERDPDRTRPAADLFADRPKVQILHSDWHRIEDHAPYDLLVLDDGGTGKTSDHTPADPTRTGIRSDTPIAIASSTATGTGSAPPRLRRRRIPAAHP